MKACFFRGFGGPEVLEYGDLPDPVPARGEVLVDIHAASVNAADWKMRAGQYPAKIDLPHVPGRDFSGVVAALGEGAGDFGSPSGRKSSRASPSASRTCSARRWR